MRTREDYENELNALETAHAQNEAGRDAFVALAHTALFASSVAFVGDIAELAGAVWKPALLLGWLASVVGLLALTISFGVARRTIDARRAALNEEEAPDSRFLEQLNALSLWSFPVSLICLFCFVAANVVSADVRQIQSTASSTTEQRGEGFDTSTESAKPRRRPADALDGSGPVTSSSFPATSASASASIEEVRPNEVP